ncbi:branched-chain amino acid ABC transporter substrate-binding protein [Ktedonosporobacter rubrisoli]|uniref:Branched-chain amino acid ABC transporter substrate-binding protein n=1 Tax=Ktedonosporobacter rubrisoli TaxID=2509675 RepID=A0A4P6JRY6_KTERU|nr:branched-chain amino acid ABC transporter substrate-binding protein [Ktedonosporobacter rubrisoli]QBD78083.1 branched-chain amino acid ABC transporter substrate-binding protein [Ktedonosporobacter rubrisoli]
MHRRWSRIFVLAMAIPLLLAMLAACGAGTTPTGNSTGNGGTAAKGSTIIKIGTDFPASGKDESTGKPAENGAHLAVDQANAQNLLPGYKFVFDPKDDVGPNGAHDPAVGQKNVTDLAGDALVAGIAGPINSNVAQSQLPVVNQVPIALISPANTNDCLTKEVPQDECGGAKSKISVYRPTGKVTYFRIATPDQYQGKALADFSYKVKGYRKAYVFDDSETYGAGLANVFVEQFKSLGGTVLDRKSVANTTTSFVNLLTQAAAGKPDVIFFGGNDSTGGTPLRQQMMQVPELKNTALIGGDGMSTSAFARTIRNTGGPVFTSVAGADAQKLDSAKKFLQDFDKVYGINNISSYSAASYDCAMIIMQAVKAAINKGVATPKDSSDLTQAKVFRQAVIDAIQNIDYNGVTGHHTFDKDGDTTNHVISIYTIADNPDQGNGWKYLTQLKY